MKTFADNKKSHFDYEILENFNAGMVLIGAEVKSIRLGRMSLAGSYVVIEGGEPYLVGAIIPPYQPKNTPQNYNEQRKRKLLLNKSEIDYLVGKTNQKGLTFVPIRVYTEKATIKLEFGLARGKKKHDKREAIKKMETRREIKKEMDKF